MTENGNVIGTVTFAGSMGLVVFVGLVFGVVAGSLWVVISPWLPAATSARVLLTIPIAVALGARGLIDDRNRDFAILRHDPLVIASLVILVALFGPALVMVDRWLDGRLPHAGRGDRRIVAGYAIVTAIGLLLTAFLVDPDHPRGRTCSSRASPSCSSGSARWPRGGSASNGTGLGRRVWSSSPGAPLRSPLWRVSPSPFARPWVPLL